MCEKHHFEFEIDRAISQQVVEKLEASPEHPLVISYAPPKGGVYVLYRKGIPVYAGKASGKTTLKSRLGDHYRKIAGRQNINVSEMTCRYLQIDSEWFIWATEQAVINHYNGAWNTTGFGSHVPGSGRPGKRGPSKWDQEFPPR